MAKTLVALFNNRAAAEKARTELSSTGSQANNVTIEDSEGSSLSHRLESLKTVGMPQKHAEAYCEGMRRGGSLLVARVDDSAVATGQQVLQRNGAVDIESRMGEWQKTGWTGFDSSAPRYTADESARESSTYATNPNANTFTIPVIEEEIAIGKRTVESGNVHVRTHVTEQPVNESIELREEHVDVQRRPVNREVNASDIDRLQDQSFDLTETREEAVVGKKAVVKEEITVSKTAEQHTENINDSVRKTEVTVDKDNDINTRR